MNAGVQELASSASLPLRPDTTGQVPAASSTLQLSTLGEEPIPAKTGVPDAADPNYSSGEAEEVFDNQDESLSPSNKGSPASKSVRLHDGVDPVGEEDKGDGGFEEEDELGKSQSRLSEDDMGKTQSRFTDVTEYDHEDYDDDREPLSPPGAGTSSRVMSPGLDASGTVDEQGYTEDEFTSDPESPA